MPIKQATKLLILNNLVSASMFLFRLNKSLVFGTTTVGLRPCLPYQPNKAKTFDYKDVDNKSDIFLLMKVVIVMGIMGACRCDEQVNLNTNNIEDNGSVLVVNILKKKNYKPRSFVVSGAEGKGFNGLETY
ncbi:hypothetical protein NQ317_018978 [Molorchus minor]|uniref:Uncharacterized protein n=1 Tax=Molorchus minor TaxID=1323400 RepID=A0ABQ9ITR8_9CUCU|nr:hypothetical protein NQ317_018978 [Molorchus minor]